MAGYWLSLYFCMFMGRDGVKVHKPVKREQGQYPFLLTEQAWPNKDLAYGFSGNISCGTQRAVPSEQRSTILPAHGDQWQDNTNEC